MSALIPASAPLVAVLEQMEGCDLRDRITHVELERFPYHTSNENSRLAARNNVRGRPWLNVDPMRYRTHL